jgi:hypothetical protein
METGMPEEKITEQRNALIIRAAHGLRTIAATMLENILYEKKRKPVSRITFMAEAILIYVLFLALCDIATNMLYFSSVKLPLLMLVIALSVMFFIPMATKCFFSDTWHPQITSPSILGKILAAMTLSIVLTFLVLVLDRTLDFSDARQVTVQIIDKDSGRGKGITLSIPPLFAHSRSYLCIPIIWSDVLDSIVPNRTSVILKLHPGFFDMPWYEGDMEFLPTTAATCSIDNIFISPAFTLC